MSSIAGSRSLQGGSEETFDHICDSCSFLGLHTEGTSFCTNCQEILCKNCTAAHKGQRMSRNHDLVSVSKLQMKSFSTNGASCKVLCDCSQNSGVASFCEDHYDVICQSCAIIKHRACKTVAISDKIALYKKEQFADVAQKADRLNGETNQLLNERKSDLKSYSAMTEKAMEEIRHFRQDINRQIDKIEQAVVTELRDRESMNRQEVDGRISSCATTKQLIQTDLKLLDDVKTSTNKADMFAADVKVSKRLAEYDRLLKEIQEEGSSTSLTFRKNEQLWELLMNIKNIGTLVEHRIETEQNRKRLFTELRIKSKRQELVKMSADRLKPNITGCVCMPDDRVVLCDNDNNKLKLLDKTFKLKDSLDLPSNPFDISFVNDTTAIITFPGEKQLQYIEVASRLKVGRVLQLDKKCMGVHVVASDIYVTCHSSEFGSHDGEVRILDNNGNLKRRLGVNQDKTFMFTWPYYLTVSTRSNNIYVSDVGKDTLTCLKSDGTVIYEYKDPELGWSRGLCIDDEDNVIVCGSNSYNIHVVTAAGKKNSVILANKDGIKDPMSVAYRQTDHTLIVGCYKNDNLLTFNCMI